jgi:hypothetical protein
MQLQVTVIDRSQLEQQGTGRNFLLSGGKSGHAVNHREHSLQELPQSYQIRCGS